MSVIALPALKLPRIAMDGTATKLIIVNAFIPKKAVDVMRIPEMTISGTSGIPVTL